VAVDEHFQPSAGVAVTVYASAGSRTEVTPGSGTTVPFEVQSGEVVAVELAEAPASGGRLLGQLATLAIGDYSAADPTDFLWEGHTLSQPLLRGYAVDMAGQTVPYDHGLWEIGPGVPESSGNFNADIALLPQVDPVDRYFGYHFANSPSGEVLGMVFRAPGVDLGAEGIAVAISLEAHAFQGVPDIVAVHMATRTTQTGTSSLVATVLHVNSERVIVHLSGKFGDGDNLVLVKDGTGANQGLVEYVSGRIGLPPSGGGGTPAATGFCDVCDPPEAPGTFICDWASALPASDPSCAFQAIWLMIGTRDWACSKVGEVCADKNGAEGTILTGKQCWSVTTTSTLEFGFGVGPGSGKKTNSRSQTFEKCIDVTSKGPDLGAGDYNNGECHAWTVRAFSEARIARYQTDGWFDLGCSNVYQTFVCAFQGPPKSEKCSIPAE
jgi:hypothetical protein